MQSNVSSNEHYRFIQVSELSHVLCLSTYNAIIQIQPLNEYAAGNWSQSIPVMIAKGKSWSLN